MTHLEALEYLENRLVTVTNGMFYILGLLVREDDCYYVFVTEKVNKSSGKVQFKAEHVAEIDVNEEAFLPNVLEHKRYMIILKN